MGIMVYSLLWVMQDFVHQPYFGVPQYNYSIMGPPNPILVIKAPILIMCQIEREERLQRFALGCFTL